MFDCRSNDFDELMSEKMRDWSTQWKGLDHILSKKPIVLHQNRGPVNFLEPIIQLMANFKIMQFWMLVKRGLPYNKISVIFRSQEKVRGWLILRTTNILWVYTMFEFMIIYVHLNDLI